MTYEIGGSVDQTTINSTCCGKYLQQYKTIENVQPIISEQSMRVHCYKSFIIGIAIFIEILKLSTVSSKDEIKSNSRRIALSLTRSGDIDFGLNF